MQNADSKPRLKAENLTEADKKILAELKRVKSDGEKSGKFPVRAGAPRTSRFFWHSFCDRHIEEAKKQTEDPAKRENAAAVLSFVLRESLKMLHPFMPFITEEIYGVVAASGNKKPMLMIEKW